MNPYRRSLPDCVQCGLINDRMSGLFFAAVLLHTPDMSVNMSMLSRTLTRVNVYSVHFLRVFP